MGNCETYLLELRERPLILWLHTRAAPTADEWARGVALMQSAGANKAFMVITDGGGPNTSQRAELQKLLQGQGLPTSVLCDDRLARGIVTAIGWFNSNIRAFASSDFPGALSHLGLGAKEGQQILHRFSLMQASLPVVGTLGLVAAAASANASGAPQPV